MWNIIFGVFKKNENNVLCNCGHGWAHTVEEAAQEAHEYYNKNFLR